MLARRSTRAVPSMLSVRVASAVLPEAMVLVIWIVLAMLTMLAAQAVSAYAAILPVPTVLEAAVVQSAEAVPSISGIPRTAKGASRMSDASVRQRCWRGMLSVEHQLPQALSARSTVLTAQTVSALQAQQSTARLYR